MNVGLPKIFDKSFEVMPYSLRHVFLNLGVSYRIIDSPAASDIR